MLTLHLLHHQPTNHIPKHQAAGHIQMRIIHGNQIIKHRVILPDPIQVCLGREVQVDNEGGARGEGGCHGEHGQPLRQQVFDHEPGRVVLAPGERGDEDGVAASGLDGKGEIFVVGDVFGEGDDSLVVVAELGSAVSCISADFFSWVSGGKGRDELRWSRRECRTCCIWIRIRSRHPSRHPGRRRRSLRHCGRSLSPRRRCAECLGSRCPSHLRSSFGQRWWSRQLGRKLEARGRACVVETQLSDMCSGRRTGRVG